MDQTATGQGTGIEFPVLAEWLNCGAPHTAKNADDCRAALMAVLQTLDDAEIMDGEQLKDLLFDYGALAEQCARMRYRYEVARTPNLVQDRLTCPACGYGVHPAIYHCGKCGQRLK